MSSIVGYSRRRGKHLTGINGRSRSRYTPSSDSTTAPFRGTLDEFAASAALAREAGYDGVEVMGSEGYLINQFLSARTNDRSDAWGGTPEKRMRFAVEIVRRIREAVGADFIIIYRLSMLDLVEGGSPFGGAGAAGFCAFLLAVRVGHAPAARGRWLAAAARPGSASRR